jgi:hypothetical protein
MEFSFDGFPFRYRRPVRWGAQLLRMVSWPWLLVLAFRPGFRNPPVAAALEPKPTVSLAQAVRYMRGLLERISSGERMTAANPSMGPLSHEQWVEVHLRHAELHLSFLVFEQDGGAANQALQQTGHAIDGSSWFSATPA